MSASVAGPWAAPLSEMAEPPLRGALQGIQDGALHGWLLDPARPLWPVIFRISMNGMDLGRHIANLPPQREAPRPEELGQLRFRVALPEGFAAADASGVTILTLDGKRGLNLPHEAAPARVSAAAEQRAPEPTPATEPEHPGLANLLDQLGPEQRVALVEKSFKAQQWPVVLALTENLPGRARDPRLVTYRGRAFGYLGRHGDAVETLRWIQTRHPQRHTAMLFLARSLASTGQLEEARQILAHCRAASPDEPRYVLEGGRVAARLAQGDDTQAEPRPELLEEANTLLRRAAEMRPQDHRPYRALAPLALLDGRLSEGLELLQAAVERAPDQAELRMELSRALARLNRIEEALAAAQAAAALDPLRDGAGFAVRILQRWLDARGTGPLAVAEIPPA